MPYPCGSNCSYTIQFEGPYFDYNGTSTNSSGTNFRKEAQRNLECPSFCFIASLLYYETYTFAQSNTNMFTPPEANTDAFF